MEWGKAMENVRKGMDMFGKAGGRLRKCEGFGEALGGKVGKGWGG